jgi:hypothetical protein
LDEGGIGRGFGMINTKKTTQDILQEEMLRERAAVLARAGEKMTGALAKLQALEREIEEMTAILDTGVEPGKAAGQAAVRGPDLRGGRTGRDGQRRFRSELNGKIGSYNRQRDHALTCYYHLIVTREAQGLIHHQRLEEFYRIPPKKHCLPEG